MSFSRNRDKIVAALIDYAGAHWPVTVRQLFHALVVMGLIEKIERNVKKVGDLVAKLRREAATQRETCAE